MRKYLIGLMALAGVLAAGTMVVAGHVASAESAETAVAIQDFAFDPAEATAVVGGSVVWTNMDSAPHTVTALDGSFDSGRLTNGMTFMLEGISLAPGTYAYQCNIHTSMQGTLIVTSE